MNEQFSIEIRDMDTIRPYPKNPRINDKAVEPVAKSIKEFGFRQPIVVDTDGVIIAGHTRFQAAQKLGLQKVPVHVATELSPEQVKAFRIADNKTGEIAEWNQEILPIEIAELQAGGFNMESLGFTEKALLQILATDLTQGNCDPDAVPLPPDAATTQKGDLWILGEHRLLCGDSAKKEDVDYLLAGNIVHLCATDPPYNVKVEPRSNNAILAGVSSFALPEPKSDTKRGREKNERKALDKQGLHHSAMRLATNPDMAPTTRKMRAKDRPLVNDFLTDAQFDTLLDGWFGNIARTLLPGHGFYIWGGYANLQNYPPMLKKHGLYFSQTIVWDKKHPVLTRKDFMGAHEICQPPETLVATPSGDKPICELKDGDEVISFAQHSSAIVGYRNGPKVRVGSRPYSGDLYGVHVGEKQTYCTDGHLFSVKLAPNAHSIWCVYLMRRGKWWRVGKTRLLTTWGLGIKQRLDMEDGEEAWVLSVHDSSTEAMCEEQIVSVRYGIPTTFWNESEATKRTRSQIEGIYAKLDPLALQRSALWALEDYKRQLKYPFIQSGATRDKYSRRISFKV